MNNKIDIAKVVKKLKDSQVQIDVYHGRVFTDGKETTIMNRYENDNLPKPMRLDNRGGFTRVVLTDKDGNKSEGKYNVPKGEQFNRKFGFKVALGKALKN